jgi:hypothetical protein
MIAVATWALANWRLVAIGLLVVALGVQTLRVAWLQADIAADKAAQADAVAKMRDRAEALSNELVIQQAIAMAKTAEKETVYVDRIKRIPVAPGEDEAARSERMRTGTAGVRDILCRDSAEAFCRAPAR